MHKLPNQKPVTWRINIPAAVKRTRLSLSLLSSALLGLTIATASQAMFMRAALVDVPIDRLLTNLKDAESSCTDDKGKANFEYRIGRLNAMRYAHRNDTTQVNAKDEDSKTVLDPALTGYETHRWPNYRQYEVAKAPLDDASKQALAEAIAHYRLSLKLEPDDVKTLLGLGWCLKEQGNSEEAREILRKTISLAPANEPDKSFGRERNLSQETALYLIPLLDRRKDFHEIRRLQALGKPDYEPHFVTPIVVPTQAGIASTALMRACQVTFDIDGFGQQKLNAWPSTNAGWLVWDPRGKGEIKCGTQLFGSSTFWLFWNNGYEALSALDDNHDGQIAGKELDGMALWRDANANGKSEPGEVQPLKHYKIKALSCTFTSSGNLLSSQHGVTFTSGKTAPTCDWVYRVKRDPDQRLAQQEGVMLRESQLMKNPQLSAKM